MRPPSVLPRMRMYMEGPMYRLLSESCSGGPCPTLRQHHRTGAVEVQGYRTTASTTIPEEEAVVLIPGDAWARLLMNLPLGMLLAALFRRPFRTRVMSGSR